MKTNAEATVKVENLITVTSQRGRELHLNDDVINALNDLFTSDEIPNMVGLIKDSIIDIYTLKAELEKAENYLSEGFIIDPNFLCYLKKLITILQTFDRCEKLIQKVEKKGGE